jgi:hypothetical protein
MPPNNGETWGEWLMRWCDKLFRAFIYYNLINFALKCYFTFVSVSDDKLCFKKEYALFEHSIPRICFYVEVLLANRTPI